MEIKQKSYLKPTAASKKKRDQTIVSLQKHKSPSLARLSLIVSNNKKFDKNEVQIILQKLLQCQIYQQFKNKASQYVKFHQHKPISLQFINSNNQRLIQQRKRNKCIGDHLLTDGKFIIHFCKLFFQSNQSKYISKKFFVRDIFDQFNHIVSVNKQQFQSYFKKINKQMDNNNKSIKRQSLAMNVSDKKQENDTQDQNQNEKNEQQQEKLNNKQLRLSKTQGKLHTKRSKSMAPIKKKHNNIKIIKKVQKKQIITQQKQQKKQQFQYQEQQQNNDDGDGYGEFFNWIQYTQKRQNKKKNCNKRYSMFANRKSQKFKFQDLFQQDPTLKPRYEQLIKKQQNQQSANKLKRNLNQICQILKQSDKSSKRLRDLQPQQLQSLSPLEKNVISMFPNINMIANRSKIIIYHCQVIIIIQDHILYFVGILEKDFDGNTLNMKRGIMIGIENQSQNCVNYVRVAKKRTENKLQDLKSMVDLYVINDSKGFEQYQ